MKTLIEYRRLRSLGFGPARALHLSGVLGPARAFCRWVLLAAVGFCAHLLVSQNAEAVNTAADNRIAAEMSKQAGYVKALEGILSKCLNGPDASIVIGDELWMCGATNTGIKVK